MSTSGEKRFGHWASITPAEIASNERKNSIHIEIDGRISESSIPDLNVCPWDNQERIDKLPKMKGFQTLESNVYWFETVAGEQKQRCCAQQETGEPLHFYIATNAGHKAEDKILEAYVLEKGRWKVYETDCEGEYLKFRSERVDAFFILGTTKEIVFTVKPSGYQYVHKSDKRVQLDFPEGSVQDSQTFKIKVFSVRVEEMRRRREQFPNTYAFLSVTKGIQVEGAALSKPVRVQLPLENIENPPGDVDTELMFFHIDGDTVNHLRNQEFEKQNDTIVTYVDKFSGYGWATRERSKIFTPMEMLIALGKMYSCKLMTFMKKISEQHVQIWCEIVKLENWKSLEKRRLDEHSNLQILPDSESQEIFLKERDRIRVNVKGNAQVAAEYPTNAMCIAFYPISIGMHIIPLLQKNASVSASPLSTITYTLDTRDKKSLHTVTFNPWTLNKSNNKKK